MAGFKTHITTSTLMGVGYTGLGLHLGIAPESALIAGGLCGVGGMLPDIDSDSGVPFRESMGFAAAIVPTLMLDRFAQLGLNYEQTVLAIGAMYLFIRFGVARLLARYTVHRGMFHSLPAAAIFAGIAFLVSNSHDLQLRYFKAGGVLLGVLSHLVLDEMYSIEWAGGRWRFKRSFGTALKLWSNSGWANFSTYAKLVLIISLILSEPMVMEEYGVTPPFDLQRGVVASQLADNKFPVVIPEAESDRPIHLRWNQAESQPQEGKPHDRTIYDTADRIWQAIRGEPKENGGY